MADDLRLLFIEDSADDTELEVRELRAAGYSFVWRRAYTRESIVRTLEEFQPTLILSDFTLPGLDGLEVLRIVRQHRPHTPFIFVSGTIGEERAIEGMKQGAWEYVLKGAARRLAPAVERVLREAEERRSKARKEVRFRRLLESDLLGIVISDLEGNILEANRAFLSMLGFSADELRSWSRVTPLRFREEDRRRAEILRTKGLIEPFERVCRHKDGHEVPMLIGATMLPGPENHCLCVAVDLTGQRRSHSQEIAAQKMDAIGRRAGDVAQLLSLMHGAGEALLRRHGQDAEVAELLRTSEQAAELTRQILAYSRRPAAPGALFDVHELLRDRAPLLRKLAGPRIAVVTTVAPEPARVQGDPAQLEQAILNLVLNARDAMPEGGRLVIESERTNGSVRISVMDTGVGMPPEVKARIFEPFFSTKEGGAGLGLPFLRSVVTQMGGSISVDSVPGRGTAFTLVLPLAEGGSPG